MKFHVKKIHLYLTNKEARELHFQPNKVNVITGRTGTGKTSIMTIIDYCLLGSESKLVEEAINENIDWYGLLFVINSKEFFIARSKMISGVLSDQIYFSSTGNIPAEPSANIKIDELRKILETEFSVTPDLVVPYGGKKIKAGSKVSFRYFLLFNTQSSNIILNPNVFFDYDLYDSEKYKEALERIFDLAIGVDTVENVIVKDKLKQIDKEISATERRQQAKQKELGLFHTRILELVAAAQKHELIEKSLFTAEDGLARLKNLIHEFREDTINTDLSELENLYNDRRILARQIRNLKRFDNEVSKYKENITQNLDSLKPIEYLNTNYSEVLSIPEVKTFMNGLGEQLLTIKDAVHNKQPFATKAREELKALEKKYDSLEEEISQFPTETIDFENSVGKFIFIGELKAKLEFYDQEWETEDYTQLLKNLNQDKEQLEKKLTENNERRGIMMELLNERFQSYISDCKSIDSYNTFKAYFNYTRKILQLREPDSSSPSNIGSSSNHMFLHLFFFLGLHEHFIREQVPYIPSFLVFDQLSQPYYEQAETDQDEIVDSQDKQKLINAFGMLNDFIKHITGKLEWEFQFILLEHAPKDYFNQESWDHFHVVEEFRNGNALINI